MRDLSYSESVREGNCGHCRVRFTQIVDIDDLELPTISHVPEVHRLLINCNVDSKAGEFSTMSEEKAY